MRKRTGQPLKPAWPYSKPGDDFADGVIAFEGQWPGGEAFVSFDKKAVALLTAQGQFARLL
jgi:Predicted nucleic-acid-binding protein, contains PIN domain